MRNEAEAEYAIKQYSDLVYRICFLYLKNHADAEDIFQTVYLKYLLYSGTFETEEHEKAWFIRVTVNACKDLLKNFFRRHMVSITEAEHKAYEIAEEDSAISEAVLSLGEKYRTVIFLFYYEEYTVPEIAKILQKKENTVYTWLSRARGLLKSRLGGEEVEAGN